MTPAVARERRRWRTIKHTTRDEFGETTHRERVPIKPRIASGARPSPVRKAKR